MSGLGAKDILRNVTALEQLIEEINFQRAKEMRQCLMSKEADTGFVVVHGTTYWTDLFVRHFLFQTDRSTDADDLLFFIRKKHVRGSRYVPKYQTEVEVYRKDSRKLPIGDPDIDWEETVYLNLIIHQFDYTLTLAVCTRTSPKDLQVLKRHSQKVYASPSRRRMDTKGEVEEITYPNVCFHVDNFDEVFCDMQVRDGEMVCVELVAADHSGARQAVIFLGSIRYDALKRVYDARASLSSKVAQRMMLGLFSGSSSQRIEFVRMKGPAGKGHAEMAVTKPKGSGVETPTSEPGVSLTDLWDQDWEDEPEDRLLYRHQRRLSDPSANFNTFINSGWRARGGAAGCNEGGGRSRSENEGLDSFADGLYEIESGDVRDASSGCYQCCRGNRDGQEAEGGMAVASDVARSHKLVEEYRCCNCGHFHVPQTSQRDQASPDDVEPVGLDELSGIAGGAKDLDEDDDDECVIQVDAEQDAIFTSKIEVVTSDIAKIDALPLVSSGHYGDSSASVEKVVGVSSKESTENSTKIEGEVSNTKESESTAKQPVFKAAQSDQTPHSSGEATKVQTVINGSNTTAVLKQSSPENSGLELEPTTSSQISNLNRDDPRDSSLQNPNQLIPGQEQDSSDHDTEKYSHLIRVPAHSDPLKCPDVAFIQSGGETSKYSQEPLDFKSSAKKSSSVAGDAERSSQTALDTTERTGSDVHSETASSRTTSSLKRTPGMAVRVTPVASTSADDEKNSLPKKSAPKKCFQGTKVTYRDLPVTDDENSEERAGNFEVVANDDDEEEAVADESVLGDPLLVKKATAMKKRKISMPYKVCPDGTRVNFLSDIKLDDGAYNPLWSTRGFTQTFHFWKENRRAQSVPFNAYLTYVTLPWFHIITDILDHETGPILTF